LFDFDALAKRLESLLAEDTAASLTYAALECRLAIERACYIRLQNAHDYISQKDLRGYRPRDVVETLLSEVDGNIASSMTVSMSPEPVDPLNPPVTAEDFEKLQYIEIGTQSALDHKKLSSLWQSLSNVALHTRLPANKHEPIPEYGNKETIRKKVLEAMDELITIAQGNLLSSGIGSEVWFTCDCGRENKRKTDCLNNGQVVRCVGPDCDGRFTVSLEPDGIRFAPRVIKFECSCGAPLVVPVGTAEKLRRDQFLGLECGTCGRHHRFMWRLWRTNGK
jgi:hypothetical protein